MTTTPDLTALLGSRICHDLISPLGAIGNGVELMMLEGTGSGPELALISDSVTSANARIRFFRIAFGAAIPEQRIGRSEVKAVLADLTRGSRLTIDWLAPDDQPRGEVKLAFILIQCLESAMPWGGRITASRDGTAWRLEGSARKLRIDPDLWAILGGQPAPATITPAQVHFALASPELRTLKRRLRTDIGETAIVLDF